jgi:hypothetical protein
MKTKEVEKTEPQKLKVELLIHEWEAVLEVIENSTSAYIQVKSVAAELVKQLQAQLPPVEELAVEQPKFKEPKDLKEDDK